MEEHTLKRSEIEPVLIEKIITILHSFGGQASRGEIREKILDEDEGIAQYESMVKFSRKTGASYKPFNYAINFAYKNLKIAGIVDYSRGNPVIFLTKKGLNIEPKSFSVQNDVYSITDSYWKQNHANNASSEKSDEEEAANDYDEIFRDKLLSAIGKMNPAKFESFSRLLLRKMGIEFTETGTQLSNDGGIDGYGYCRTDDFRTSRVVIQCKRWKGNVGSTEIDAFLGAMNKFQAD